MDTLAIKGIGMILPGVEEPCENKEKFRRIVRNGKCQLKKVKLISNEEIKIAGVVDNQFIDDFNLPERYKKKYSKAAFLGAVAVKNALKDANISQKEMQNKKIAIFCASSIFAQENVSKMYEKYYLVGREAVGFDFMLQGTPASVPCAISKLLELDCPIYPIAGSCVSSPQALQFAIDKIELNKLELAIVVGVDALLEPLYLASSTYRMKNGQTLSNLTELPQNVSPHSGCTKGNACGEGAIAIVLGKYDLSEKQYLMPFKVYYENSRKNGTNIFDAGEPSNIVATVLEVLSQAKIELGDVTFINSFCEGTTFIEDFFNEMIHKLRKTAKYDGELLISNQEAAFGHIGGATGLIKVISNLMSMQDGEVYPVINCKNVNPDLEATPVIGSPLKKDGKYSLVINNGAGGDCSVLLLEKYGEKNLC